MVSDELGHLFVNKKVAKHASCHESVLRSSWFALNNKCLVSHARRRGEAGKASGGAAGLVGSPERTRRHAFASCVLIHMCLSNMMK